MTYRTVIEMVTKAKNKAEAMDLVDEYLSGNIVSGVKMRCSTRPYFNKAAIVGAMCVSIAAVVGLSALLYLKPVGRMDVSFSGVGAVQPVLKTSVANDVRFKSEWESKQSKQLFDSIVSKR